MDFNNDNNPNQNTGNYNNQNTGGYNNQNNGGYNNQNNGNGMPNGYHYMPPARTPGSGLANAAIVLGIVAIITAVMMTLYLPFILGSLAIVLALLSKGTAEKLTGQAKAAISCGTVSLVINLAIFITSVAYVFSNPEMLIETAQMYDNTIEQMYGESSEEIFGESMEDMIGNMLDSFR